MYGILPEHLYVIEVHIAAYLHIIADSTLYGSACHTEDTVGIHAEGFLINEVAPAADALSEEKSDNGYIHHRQDLDLAYPCDYISYDEGTYDTAVHGKSAVSGVDYRLPVPLVFVPFHQHVVNSCADYSADNAEDYNIYGSVVVKAEALHLGKHIAECKDKSEGYCVHI